MQEIRVWSLGQEDPLEADMATHSSIPTWRIPWTDKSSGLQSIELQRVKLDWSNLACTHSSLEHSQDNLFNGRSFQSEYKLNIKNVSITTQQFLDNSGAYWKELEVLPSLFSFLPPPPQIFSDPACEDIALNDTSKTNLWNPNICPND